MVDNKVSFMYTCVKPDSGSKYGPPPSAALVMKRGVPMKLSIREICHMGIFMATIAVCAQISLSLGNIPFTMQTWAVSLSGAMLGAKKGTITTCVYVLMGAIGLPVFAHFSGGFGSILGYSGGFIITFPILALSAGLGAVKGRGRALPLYASMLAGTVINLSTGMFWFAFVAETTLSAAFTVAVAPFILPDILKIATIPPMVKLLRRY